MPFLRPRLSSNQPALWRPIAPCPETHDYCLIWTQPTMRVDVLISVLKTTSAFQWTQSTVYESAASWKYQELRLSFHRICSQCSKSSVHTLSAVGWHTRSCLELNALKLAAKGSSHPRVSSSVPSLSAQTWWVSWNPEWHWLPSAGSLAWASSGY